MIARSLLSIELQEWFAERTLIGDLEKPSKPKSQNVKSRVKKEGVKSI